MPRLLIVKTSSLGDVIHNLPILADIRAHFPDMQCDWVVEEGFADIPALHPAVDAVIPVAVRRWRRSLFSASTWSEISAFGKRLRERQYDFILDTQGLLKSALIARAAHGIRHGQDRHSAREPLAAMFYQHSHAVPRGQHAVARNRALAALALGYPVPASAPDYGLRVLPTASTMTLPEPYIIGLHATSRDSKLWPAENWVALGRELSRQGTQLLLPWGNEKEHLRAQHIAGEIGQAPCCSDKPFVPSLSKHERRWKEPFDKLGTNGREQSEQHCGQAKVLPRLRLKELAGILAGARAVVGVDTGLVHLAVALNLPTVALYTDTDPSLTGVYPADFHRARNLGGIGRNPDVASVLAALGSITDRELSAS